MDTKKNWRQGRKTGRTIIISCICVMCKSGEMGQRQCLGGRKGRREKDTGRLNPNEGALLQPESACVSLADGLLSDESWGVGAESFSLCPGWPILYPILHLCLPLSLRLCSTLFCLLLFCASLCISLLLTLSHTKQRGFFSFMEGGA